MHNLSAYEVTMRLTVDDMEAIVAVLQTQDGDDAYWLRRDFEEMLRFHILGDQSACTFDKVTNIVSVD